MKQEQYVCLVCGFNMIGFHAALKRAYEGR
jgi:hypothetical protein